MKILIKTLAEAARTGNVEQIEVMLAADGNPNESESAAHWSPLIEAAYGNHAEIADLLLESGADHYAQNKSGETMLQVAVKQKSWDVVRVLRSYGYRPEAVREHTCALLFGAYQNADIVEWLVSEGIDVDATDEAGRTALMWAVYYGDVEPTATLLRLGANPNHRDANGSSVFRWALYSPPGNPDDALILRMLIKAGADLFAALLDALSLGHVTAVEQLLVHGLDVNATDDRGHSFLYYAQRRSEDALNKEAIVCLLRKQGARLNGKDVEVLAEDRT